MSACAIFIFDTTKKLILGCEHFITGLKFNVVDVNFTANKPWLFDSVEDLNIHNYNIW